MSEQVDTYLAWFIPYSYWILEKTSYKACYLQDILQSHRLHFEQDYDWISNPAFLLKFGSIKIDYILSKFVFPISPKETNSWLNIHAHVRKGTDPDTFLQFC